jgi:hypothetical protein
MTAKRPRLTQAECDHLRMLVGKHGVAGAARRYGCSYSTVVGLQRRYFTPAKPRRRPLPDDWYQVAPGQTEDWLQKHYRVGRKGLYRWFAQHPVTRRAAGPKPLPVPEFTTEMIEWTAARLGTHFGVSEDTALKWRRFRQAEALETERARLAAIPQFERTMEAVRNGRGLVDKFVMPRVEPGFTLGGVSEMTA